MEHKTEWFLFGLLFAVILPYVTHRDLEREKRTVNSDFLNLTDKEFKSTQQGKIKSRKKQIKIFIIVGLVMLCIAVFFED
jgi:hypothetical protein